MEIGGGSNVEQPLIRLGVLHNGGRLPLHGQDQRRLVFLICFISPAELRRKVVSD